MSSIPTPDMPKYVFTTVSNEHLANNSQVGGLPLVELNHLELQFLLLNDFRLAVPLEEMEEGIEHLYAKRHSSAIPNWQMMME
jgi:hypothetical protein